MENKPTIIWSKNDEARYNMLYSYLKKELKNLDEFSFINDNKLDEFTFINDNKKDIFTLIENNNKWSDKSKEALLFMVSKYLKTCNDFKYSKIYSLKGYNYLEKNKEIESHNEQDSTEIENYRDHKYFLNILESINYDNIKTINEHYKYLLLSLLIYQPPVRTSFYINSKFIFRAKDNNKINNFIYINKRKPFKISYIINNDKVSKTKIYKKIKLSIININNKKLIDLIIDSYSKYPRTYLFEVNKKYITQPTLLSWLRDITKVNAINNDIMRSSYINWFYEHNKTIGEREKLSYQMRHSVITAQRNYLKIINEETIKQQPEKIIELQTNIYNLKKNNNDIIPDLLYKKRRRDNIRTLNNGGIPRESTLLKYNIEYDEQNKIYK